MRRLARLATQVIASDASDRSAERPLVVTGGASGMGRATARLMAQRGHPIALLDLDQARLEEAAAELQTIGARVIAIPTNVRSRSELEQAFASAEAALGPCWALAAAAGIIGASVDLIDATDTQILEIVETNVLGLLTANQLAARQMRQRADGGRIVNWSSDSAVGATPGNGVYGASKAAVISLTRTLAVELAPFGITANAILPGVIDTPMAGYLSDAWKERFAELIPVGRWGQADEVAGLAAFMFSPDSSYMSGAAVLIDGAATPAMGRHLFEQLLPQ
jgi:NAD(P)-dependent dehydrogenase (short-subunit alcohol dehydrogenase family)